MKVELGKIGHIRQGVVLNRVKGKAGEPAQTFPILTIGCLLREEEGIFQEEQPVVCVAQSRRAALKLAEEGMILIGLTSFHRAVVLTKEKEGMVIPSNFLILEFPGGIMDAHYFAWYFNESSEMKLQKENIIHGEGKVKVLSIQQIRGLKMEIPDLVTQMAIGNLYALQQRKACLWKQILRLEMKDLTTRMELIGKSDTEQNAETQWNAPLNELYTQLHNIDNKIPIYEKEAKVPLRRRGEG